MTKVPTNKVVSLLPVYLTKDAIIDNFLISRPNRYNHEVDERRSKNIEF